MTMTLSPQSTWGVKLGLCLPRRTLAMIVAARPTTRPSASTICHFFSTSCGLTDLVVFISAFMAWDLSFETYASLETPARQPFGQRGWRPFVGEARESQANARVS